MSYTTKEEMVKFVNEGCKCRYDLIMSSRDYSRWSVTSCPVHNTPGKIEYKPPDPPLSPELTNAMINLLTILLKEKCQTTSQESGTQERG